MTSVRIRKDRRKAQLTIKQTVLSKETIRSGNQGKIGKQRETRKRNQVDVDIEGEKETEQQYGRRN